jgi:hypothetical protein
MPFEELLTRYAQLLQQEIIRTDLVSAWICFIIVLILVKYWDFQVK